MTINPGTNVNVTLSDGIYIGTVTKVTNSHAWVDFGDGEKPTRYKLEALKERRRGRLPLSEELTPEERQAQVDQLIAELEAAPDVDAKKRLRRLLRRRGHTGGLGIRQAQQTAEAS